MFFVAESRSTRNDSCSAVAPGPDDHDGPDGSKSPSAIARLARVFKARIE